MINNEEVKVKLDTSAEVNAMLMRVFKQIEDGHVKIEKTKTKLCGYDGTNISVEGKIKVMREFRDAKQKLELYVMKTDCKTVLSLQTCREFGMIQILNEVTSKEYNKKVKDGTSMERAGIEKKVEMIAGKSAKELRQTVMKMYPNLFKSLGKMEPEHHIKLKEDISPNVHPPRKIPVSLRGKIKEESDIMETTVVIRKIDKPREWVNSVVVVEKDKWRIKNFFGSQRLRQSN